MTEYRLVNKKFVIVPPTNEIPDDIKVVIYGSTMEIFVPLDQNTNLFDKFSCDERPIIYEPVSYDHCKFTLQNLTSNYIADKLYYLAKDDWKMY